MLGEGEKFAAVAGQRRPERRPLGVAIILISLKFVDKLCRCRYIYVYLRVYLFYYAFFFTLFSGVFSVLFGVFSAAAFLFPLFLSLSVPYPPLLSIFFLLLAHNQIKCDFVLNFSQRLCTHFGTAFRVARVAGSFAKRGQGAGI